MRKLNMAGQRSKPGTFGFLLYEARLAGNITLAAAAEKAKITAIYLSMIEQGARVPQLSAVPRIAKAVRLNPGELCWRWLRDFSNPVWRAMSGVPDDPEEGPGA